VYPRLLEQKELLEVALVQGRAGEEETYENVEIYSV